MGRHKVKCFISTNLRSNCYIIDSADACIIIDPGEITPGMLGYLQGRKVDYILLTHGHYDHTAGVKQLKKMTGAQVGIHHLEAGLLLDPFSIGKSDPAGVWPDILFEGEETIQCASLSVKVLYTPGHSSGSVSYLLGDEYVFTGDTLMPDMAEYYEEEKDRDSIRNRLLSLGERILICPGHGRMTTIRKKEEIDSFPFIREFFYG